MKFPLILCNSFLCNSFLCNSFLCNSFLCNSSSPCTPAPTSNPVLTLLVFGVLFSAGQNAWSLDNQDSWNRFRGPNGTGVVSDAEIPTEFGPEQNVKWKAKIPKGFSSPVFEDGKIFLTAEEEKQLYTICLDQQNGREIWRKRAPRPRIETLDPRNHPASPSPVVANGRVVVFFPDFGLIAYQTDGTELWQKQLGPFNNLYGMGASPIVVDDRVILVCDQNLDSFIVALEIANGGIAWKTQREEATSGHCSPVVYRPESNTADAQIVVAGSFNLTSYAASTGEKLWWVGGLCFEMKSTPFLQGDVAYINGFGSPQNQPDQNFDIETFSAVIESQDRDDDQSLSMRELPDELSRNFFPAVDLDGDQKLNEREWNYFRASIASKNSMMAIRMGGSGDMTRRNTLWKYHRNIPQLPSPVLIESQLLMISDRGIVTSLNPASGDEQYKGRIPGASGSVYASPVVAGNKVLFATTNGKIAVIQTGNAMNVLAINDLGEEIYATPAIVNDQIFVRTNQSLYCFGE